MKQKIRAAMAAGLLLTVGASFAASSIEVVSSSEVEFVPLNPARGDASPQAGVLWGNIRRNIPSGAVIRFADGFASPPHIHNVTYRAVVIEGLVHNDDPNADPMWMRPGSFWTQPAGAPHITSVGPGGGTAFLEILSGPYLVEPVLSAFDKDEQPINMEAGNVVWITASDVAWVETTEEGTGEEPSIAFLWGDSNNNELNGTFLRLPSNFDGALHTQGGEMKTVLIQGQINHSSKDSSPPVSLDPGSYFGSRGLVTHDVVCESNQDCILYLRSEGKYKLIESG